MEIDGDQRREAPPGDQFWIPDNPDGSGWAPVDWMSAARGSRYHYCHAPSKDAANCLRPRFYRVVTRYEAASVAAHENSYYIERDRIVDFLAELSLLGGAETLWHVEPCPEPPVESRAPGG